MHTINNTYGWDITSYLGNSTNQIRSEVNFVYVNLHPITLNDSVSHNAQQHTTPVYEVSITNTANENNFTGYYLHLWWSPTQNHTTQYTHTQIDRDTQTYIHTHTDRQWHQCINLQFQTFKLQRTYTCMPTDHKTFSVGELQQVFFSKHIVRASLKFVAPNSIPNYEIWVIMVNHLQWP